MIAQELKKQYFKKGQLDKVCVVGHLTSCVEGGEDNWYH
ncbi:unnamed protein product, partial [marine sediment metagenome]